MEREIHIPVLLTETIDALAIKAGGKYVDGTLGRAGHSRKILEAGGEVLGIDRDDQALEAVKKLGLKGISIVKGVHSKLKELANENGWNEVDGILLDLGVSSPQLDEAGRGFSFLRDGPLDMRMDRSSGISAAEIVNEWSAEELSRIFRELGEELNARRIAKAIEARRGFHTTVELADFIERLIGRHGGHHPATKVFQALRMVVNDEIGELERALNGGLELLSNGGRFAVITFESITDRMVKRFFHEHAGRMKALQQGGETWEGKLPKVKLINRKAITARPSEISANPRSRSAKLRVVEKENL